MKRTLMGTALLGGAFLASVAGAAGSSQYVQGRVLQATPIVRIVQVAEPREVCRDEIVTYRRRSAAAPTALGVIIGGAVGNQFGEGKGKDALTLAGAALGGAIAHDQASRGQRGERIRTTCDVVEDYREEERIVGYRVEYEYAGQVYTTRTERDPGDYIDLRVSVSPVGR